MVKKERSEGLKNKKETNPEIEATTKALQELAGNLDDGKPDREKDPVQKEIERKFLISSFPENLQKYPHKEIIQGYVSIAEDGTEVRVRRKGNKYFQTTKSGSGKTRTEIEEEITQKDFDELWKQTEGRRLEKTRYEIPDDSGTIELDVYRGDLAGLVTAEVEFKSEEDSEKFIPPSWFGGEVTEDKRYKNQNLALHGKPEQETLDIPEYELDEGVQKLVSLVNEKSSQQTRPVIVEIAGGSASGKTSAVADKVKKSFGADAVILSMDDYYRGRKFMEDEARKDNVLNWDQPEALNLDLFREHLKALKRGESIQKPVYDFKTSESESTEEVKPKKVIVVEGLFALNDAVAGEGDVKAFVDIGTHGRILRRLLRDVERTGQNPSDILKYFSEVVEPMHEKYIQSTKKNADIVIRNEYKPRIEAQKSGLHEVQLKFSGEINPEILRKLGAERLSATTQIDHYYNPKDRNLADTDEALRIREEGGHKILTYKGPRVESGFRKRPKFEFEIDDETGGEFLAIYGGDIKTIRKERVLYQLSGVTFSVDSVVKVENGEETDLGKFIEIRSAGGKGDEEKVREVIARLGLSFEDGTKKSYAEM